MSIGERLRKTIKNANMKMTDFSKKTGIPYRTIQEYVANRNTPGGESLIKICTELCISMDWLMTGQGEIYRREPPKELVTNLELELLFNWLTEWWKNADDKNRNWLEIQMKRSFPEYAEWITQHEKH